MSEANDTEHTNYRQRLPIHDTVPLEGLGYEKGSVAHVILNATKALRRAWTETYEPYNAAVLAIPDEPTENDDRETAAEKTAARKKGDSGYA